MAEEFNRRDINQAHLLAYAPIIGRACLEQNKAFMKCRVGDDNPDNCVDEGRAVHECVYKMYSILFFSIFFIFINLMDLKRDDFFHGNQALKNFTHCLEAKSFFYDACEKEKLKWAESVAVTKYGKN